MPKILLIEDNTDDCEALSALLRQRGFDVVPAANGQTGVELARIEKPDLVLMDMSMPVMDGWQATELLHADAETTALPVIAITAHHLPGHREKALACGCSEYHTKPIDFPKLMGQIERLLKTLHRDVMLPSPETVVAETPDGRPATGAA